MDRTKVYAQVDAGNRIIRVEGGYTECLIQDYSAWVCIDEGSGERYAFCQQNYFPLPLMTDGGAYRYKLVNGKVAECTPEEIQEQGAANQPELPPDPGDYEARIQALEEELAAAKIILGWSE